MASGWFDSGLRDVLDGTISLITDTIKLMLVGPGYAPNKAHDFIDDLVAQELSGPGYTGGFGGAGRKTIAGKAWSTDTTNHRVEFTFNGVLWVAIDAGIGAYGILVKEITNDAASRLIGYLDFNPDVQFNGGDFTGTPDATLGALYVNA